MALRTSRLVGLRRDLSLAARRGLRLASWALHADGWPPPQLASGDFPHAHLRLRVPIASAAVSDPRFERGKRHNLRLAAPAFDGLLLTPTRPLSFWRTLGRVTEAGGYVHGMALLEGCVVPALGGGLCLLSNALFTLAARLGWTIQERHGHSVAVTPPTHQPHVALDATVAWPHVDLVVAPRCPVRLTATVTADQLVLSIDARAPLELETELVITDQSETVAADGTRVYAWRTVRSCRSLATGALLSREVIAVDRKRLLESGPELRSCLSCGEHTCRDRVLLPDATFGRTA